MPTGIPGGPSLGEIQQQQDNDDLAPGEIEKEHGFVEAEPGSGEEDQIVTTTRRSDGTTTTRTRDFGSGGGGNVELTTDPVSPDPTTSVQGLEAGSDGSQVFLNQAQQQRFGEGDPAISASTLARRLEQQAIARNPGLSERGVRVVRRNGRFVTEITSEGRRELAEAGVASSLSVGLADVESRLLGDGRIQVGPTEGAQEEFETAVQLETVAQQFPDAQSVSIRGAGDDQFKADVVTESGGTVTRDFTFRDFQSPEAMAGGASPSRPAGGFESVRGGTPGGALRGRAGAGLRLERQLEEELGADLDPERDISFEDTDQGVRASITEEGVETLREQGALPQPGPQLRADPRSQADRLGDEIDMDFQIGQLNIGEALASTRRRITDFADTGAALSTAVTFENLERAAQEDSPAGQEITIEELADMGREQEGTLISVQQRATRGALALPALPFATAELGLTAVELGAFNVEETAAGRGSEAFRRSGDFVREGVEEEFGALRGSFEQDPLGTSAEVGTSLVGTALTFGAASRISPRTGAAVRTAVQPGEEIASASLTRTFPRVASRFPNNRIDNEEIMIRAAQRAGSRARGGAARTAAVGGELLARAPTARFEFDPDAPLFDVDPRTFEAVRPSRVESELSQQIGAFREQATGMVRRRAAEQRERARRFSEQVSELEFEDLTSPADRRVSALRSQAVGELQGAALGAEAAIFNLRRGINDVSLRPNAPDFDLRSQLPSLNRPTAPELNLDVAGQIEAVRSDISGRVAGRALEAEAALFRTRQRIASTELPSLPERPIFGESDQLVGPIEGRLLSANIEATLAARQARSRIDELTDIDVDLFGGDDLLLGPIEGRVASAAVNTRLRLEGMMSPDLPNLPSGPTLPPIRDVTLRVGPGRPRRTPFTTTLEAGEVELTEEEAAVFGVESESGADDPLDADIEVERQAGEGQMAVSRLEDPTLERAPRGVGQEFDMRRSEIGMVESGLEPLNADLGPELELSSVSGTASGGVTTQRPDLEGALDPTIESVLDSDLGIEFRPEAEAEFEAEMSSEAVLEVETELESELETETELESEFEVETEPLFHLDDDPRGRRRRGDFDDFEKTFASSVVSAEEAESVEEGILGDD